MCEGSYCQSFAIPASFMHLKVWGKIVIREADQTQEKIGS